MVADQQFKQSLKYFPNDTMVFVIDFVEIMVLRFKMKCNLCIGKLQF